MNIKSKTIRGIATLTWLGRALAAATRPVQAGRSPGTEQDGQIDARRMTEIASGHDIARPGTYVLTADLRAVP